MCSCMPITVTKDKEATKIQQIRQLSAMYSNQQLTLCYHEGACLAVFLLLN